MGFSSFIRSKESARTGGKSEGKGEFHVMFVLCNRGPENLLGKLKRREFFRPTRILEKKLSSR
jgi:hypothetical protein